MGGGGSKSGMSRNTSSGSSSSDMGGSGVGQVPRGAGSVPQTNLRITGNRLN